MFNVLKDCFVIISPSNETFCIKNSIFWVTSNLILCSIANHPFLISKSNKTRGGSVALVIGDALAMALLHARDFKADDFALSHPGGALGKRLLLTVGQLMHSGDTMACVADTATLQDALLEMSSKRLGMTTIVDEQHRLLGLFTDGDLRRAMTSGKNLLDRPIHELMVTNFKTTQADTRVFETFNQMEQHKITTMPVVDTGNRLVGILHLHDILQAGVIG